MSIPLEIIKRLHGQSGVPFLKFIEAHSAFWSDPQVMEAIKHKPSKKDEAPDPKKLPDRVLNYITTTMDIGELVAVKVSGSADDRTFGPITFRVSAPEKVRQLIAGQVTHNTKLSPYGSVVESMPILDLAETSLPYVGTHLIPLEDRVDAQLNAADTPIYKQIRKAARCQSDAYPLPEGVSLDDLPDELVQQINMVMRAVQSESLVRQPARAYLGTQVLLPLADNQYLAVSPVASPAAFNQVGSAIRAYNDVADEHNKARAKIKSDKKPPYQRRLPHTPSFAFIGKLQNLSPSLARGAIFFSAPPVVSGSIRQAARLVNAPERFIEKSLRSEVGAPVIRRLAALRKEIAESPRTSSRQRVEFGQLLDKASNLAIGWIARLYDNPDSLRYLSGTTWAPTSLDTRAIAQMIVDTINRMARPDDPNYLQNSSMELLSGWVVCADEKLKKRLTGQQEEQ